MSMSNLKENIENTYNTDQIEIKVNEDEYKRTNHNFRS